MRRRWWLPPLLLAAALLAADRLLPPDLSRYRTLSLAVQGRDGTVLDVLTSRDGAWRLPATPADVDPSFIRLLLQTEDRRFWNHPGIDPLALARALGQFITRGHVVSGGSTLTMQVARLLSPHPRNLLGKLTDIARALQLEERFSKPQILSMYLTLAPYGGNIEGIRAASLLYFQKAPAHLTLDQAALLVALPRSPTRLRPDRHPAAALRAANRVLAQAGLAGQGPAALPNLTRHPPPALAPHLAERLRGTGHSGMVATTLDAALQSQLDALAAREQPWLGAKAGIAALVVRNRDRAILGYLGGADYFAPQGMVDMVRAVRSPGSTLKPFIYGMALDDALIVPDSLIADAPIDAGGYAPVDFDRSFRGLVPVREALQQSYNLPAVLLLRAVGPARFLATLRGAGVVATLPPGGAASLPIALGGIGITMQALATLYCGLADNGAVAPLRLLPEQPAPAPVPVMTPAAAAQIGAMLRGAPLPDGIAPDQARPIAYKTGTSYGSRDAWAAGYSADYTIVVWVGRVDGTPQPGAYGRLTAAPLLYKIFALLPADAGAVAVPPASAALGTLAPSLRIFGSVAGAVSSAPRLRILFPPDGAVLQSTDLGGAAAPLALQAAGGAPPYRWIIDGTPLPLPAIGMSMSWQPGGPGFAHIAVLDANDDAASESVELR